MLKLRDEQRKELDPILHESLGKLPGEWKKIDRLLDELLEDESFIEFFLKKHATGMGRPTYPIEKYLRLMVVKFHYKWGYETLVKEVRDSFTLRCFCRIALDELMPHSTTLIKIHQRYGEHLSEKLNQLLD